MEFDLLQGEYVEQANANTAAQLELAEQAKAQLRSTEAKVQNVYSQQARAVDASVLLAQDANRLTRNKSVMTSENMEQVLPDYLERLTGANEAVQASEALVLEAVKEFKATQRNEATPEGKAGAVISNILFGSSAGKVAEAKLKQAETLRSTTVGLRDDLESAYTDTLTVLKNRTAQELNFIETSREIADNRAVQAGDVAKLDLQIKRINSNQNTQAAVAQLDSKQLKLKESSIKTAYNMKVARYQELERQEAKRIATLDKAEAKQQIQLSKQVNYYTSRLTSGNLEYSRIANSVSKLKNISQDMLADVTELGATRNTLDVATMEIQQEYSRLAMGAATSDTLEAKLEAYSDANNAYVATRNKVNSRLMADTLADTKKSADAERAYLAKLNAVENATALPTSTTLKAFTDSKKRNPELVKWVAKTVALLPDGADPSEAVESTEPFVFIGNIEESVKVVGRQRAEMFYGSGVFEAYDALKQSTADIVESNLITGSKPVREAKIAAMAQRDSRVAQLNALNPSAPTNAFSDLFAITDTDLASLTNNTTAQAFAVAVKGAGGKLDVPTLQAFVASRVKRAGNSSDIVEAATEVSAILKAVYATKPDFTALNLGAADYPVISLRVNKTGDTKKGDFIKLDSPSSVLKMYLQLKKDSPKNFGLGFPNEAITNNKVKEAAKLIEDDN